MAEQLFLPRQNHAVLQAILGAVERASERGAQARLLEELLLAQGIHSAMMEHAQQLAAAELGLPGPSQELAAQHLDTAHALRDALAQVRREAPGAGLAVASAVRAMRLVIAAESSSRLRVLAGLPQEQAWRMCVLLDQAVDAAGRSKRASLVDTWLPGWREAWMEHAFQSDMDDALEEMAAVIPFQPRASAEPEQSVGAAV